jgi:bifunctional DNase/RNase
MIETVVEAIRINVVTDQHVVILKELEGSRIIPIWIGAFEAQAIALELQGTEAPRPMTHDLLSSVIGQMGGSVERIVIGDLRDGTFYASIGLAAGGGQLEVDSRPSDAIALAVRTQAPIFVAEQVIDQAGVSMGDSETEPEQEESPPPELVDNARLNVFRDFVNSLDMDDPKRESE